MSVTNCAELVDILDILNVECGRIKECIAICICKGTHPRYVSVTLRYGNRFMDLLEGVRVLSLFYDSKRITKICQSHKMTRYLNAQSGVYLGWVRRNVSFCVFM